MFSWSGWGKAGLCGSNGWYEVVGVVWMDCVVCVVGV